MASDIELYWDCTRDNLSPIGSPFYIDSYLNSLNSLTLLEFASELPIIDFLRTMLLNVRLDTLWLEFEPELIV